MQQTQSAFSRIQIRLAGWQQRRRIAVLAGQVAGHARPDPTQRPVVVFNASTRLTGLSLNAAFSLLTGWSLRLAGVPVVHFVCQSGLQPCVLGTSREDYTQPAALHRLHRPIQPAVQRRGRASICLSRRPPSRCSPPGLERGRARQLCLRIPALRTSHSSFPTHSLGEPGAAVYPLGAAPPPPAR